MAAPAMQHHRTVRNGIRDVLFNFPNGLVVDQWAELHVRLQAIADAQLAHALDQHRGKRVYTPPWTSTL